MELTSESAEMSYSWLLRSYESRKDHVENLAWRVGTMELHRAYEKWIRSTRFAPLTQVDIWGIIQIAWPWVTIIGAKGNRVYTGMTKRECLE